MELKQLTIFDREVKFYLNSYLEIRTSCFFTQMVVNLCCFTWMQRAIYFSLVALDTAFVSPHKSMKLGQDLHVP